MARKFSNEKIARKIKNSYMVGGGVFVRLHSERL